MKLKDKIQMTWSKILKPHILKELHLRVEFRPYISESRNVLWGVFCNTPRTAGLSWRYFADASTLSLLYVVKGPINTRSPLSRVGSFSIV